MSRPTKVIINLKHLEENLSAIKRHIGSQVKIMPMVKADAYGHGILPVAKACQRWGADFLGVALVEEGRLLRENGITIPILCVGALTLESIPEFLQYDISVTVFDADTLSEIGALAAKLDKTAKVHIKLETGMNRLGVHIGSELDTLLVQLKQCTHIALEGVFTHFATSDCLDKSYTKSQNILFMQGLEQIKSHGFEHFIRHASCSGAIIDCPELNYDMVRPGIAIYGYYPSSEVKKAVALKPVLSWETEIIAVKNIEAGDTVSYGQTYKAEKNARLAVLPVGYGDGYFRALSNKGYVLIDGQKAPIVGRICMDQLMADITGMEHAQKGSPVVLIGTQQGESIGADIMAQLCGTISYEITLSISARVPKEYIHG